MHYVKAQGLAPAATFATVIRDGLAPDGGRYVPRALPRIEPATIDRLAGADFVDTANVAREDLRSVIDGLGLKQGFDIGLEMSGKSQVFDQMVENR
jgi:threonine synthase